MDAKVLAPIPRWLTVIHGMALVLSLLVISVPEARNVPLRILLTMLSFFILLQSVLRLKRANGMRTPMSELGKHLPPTSSFSDSLAMIAMIVSGCTMAFAF